MTYLKLLLIVLVLVPLPLCAADLESLLELGVTYHGTAKSSDSGKSWPFEISFDRLGDKGPQTLDAMLSWPSLASVHAVIATRKGDTLAFTETEAVVKGKAHLGVRYEGKLVRQGKSARLEGTYRDPAGDKGSFVLILADARGKRFDMRRDVFDNTPRRGTAKSAKSGKSWPFVLTLDGSMVTELQDCEGVLEWPTLGSRHKVRGLYMHGRLEFKEAQVLKKGKAHLGVRYTLWLADGALVGNYRDPAGDHGTVHLPLP